jgi:predicted dehydrogenase
MAIDLTPEQRQIGEANFKAATDKLGLTRRDVLKGAGVAAGAVALSAGAAYFGYKSVAGKPVTAALIGGGDEGGVLVGEHNPESLQFRAVCDMRPYNMQRIFEGEPGQPLRKGFKKVYGAEADKIARFTDLDSLYGWLASDKGKEVESVVIALPLHLHAPVAVQVLQIGKQRGKPIHVLCEKLMAWNIKQCKQMIKTAKDTNSILSIGHQRHYSMVYAHAQEVVKSGLLGDLKHIRALWHRNFSWPYKHDPKKFAWAFAGSADPAKKAMQAPGITEPKIRDGWFQPVLRGDLEGLEEEARAAGVTLKEFLKRAGFDSVEQLVRWRLYAETGGGLMAELGSHQLDACSIFLGKVHPLAVQGFGGKLFFGPGKNDRNIDDHVFVTYEFPGKKYFKRDDKGNIQHDGRGRPLIDDRHDVVVMTYSSISTNGFEPYGECLMGSRGTLLVEGEQRVMLFAEKDPTSKVKGTPRSLSVEVTKLGKDQAAAESTSTWGLTTAVPAGGGATARASGPISRGYREEMEDFAYCVRLWDARKGYEKNEEGKYVQRLPRCHGEVAMADAIVALTSNQAMHEHQRITFKDEWFDSEKMDKVPDSNVEPKVEVKMEA